MSDSGKAVFLSYASQDKEVALRICEALRAAGVEVWFDQSELVGGDAWDQKIRKQIRECALFIPILSKATQGRREAYFRLEWKLADERTHLMAKGTPFLLPVTIDETNDRDALVPDSFLAVQWTKAPGGEVLPACCARVRKLLDGDAENAGAALRRPSLEDLGREPPSREKRSAWVILSIAGVVALVAAGTWFALPRPPSSILSSSLSASIPATGVPAPESAARQQVARAWKLSQANENSTTGLLAAADLAEKATGLDSTDAKVWAIAGLVDIRCWVLSADQTEKRQEMARTKILRAKSLEPRLVDARLAEARMLTELNLYPEGGAKAEAILRELLPETKGTPQETDVTGTLGLALAKQGRVLEGAHLLEEAGQRDPGWITAASWRYLLLGRFDDALRTARQMTVRNRTGGLIQQVLVQMTREDLDAANEVFEQIPSAELTDEVPAAAAVLLAYLRREPDRQLAALRNLPGDYMENLFLDGPKAAFVADAHLMAGRREAALIHAREALVVVDARIAAKGANAVLLAARLRVLVQLGRRDVAEQVYRGLRELRGQKPVSEAHYLMLLGRKEEALATLEQGLQKTPSFFARTFVRYAPDFDPLHGDPRFEKLLRKTLPAGAKPFDDPKPVAGPPRLGPKSIAVLPFDNLSEEKEANAFFADGMHEDIITDLSVIRELHCVPRSVVLAYRGTKMKLHEVADELGVAYLLTGTVRRADKRVRITGTLINPRTDETLWVKPYNKELTDVFSIQSELAQAIAGELKATLSPEEKSVVERVPTTNPAAYDLYLKARATVADGFTSRTDVGREKAMALLAAAVQLDPDFGAAWCELASLQVFFYRFGDTSPEQFARAKQALEAAARVMPDTPEYLHARANFNYRGLGDYAAAAGDYERLVRLRPNDALARHDYGALLRRLDRPGDSLRELRAAADLDPRNRNIVEDLAITLRFFRRYDEAMTAQRQVVALKPDDLQQQFNLAFDNFHARGSTREVDELLAGWSPGQARSPEGVGLRIVWAGVRGNSGEVLPLIRSLGALDDPPYWLWKPVVLARQMAGDEAGAKAYLDKNFNGTAEWTKGHPAYYGGWLSLAEIEALRGNKAAALAALQRAREAIPAVDTWTGLEVREHAAFVHLALGDKERALEEIAYALQHGMTEMSVHTLKNDLAFATLRDDARFQALLTDPKNNAPIY